MAKSPTRPGLSASDPVVVELTNRLWQCAALQQLIAYSDLIRNLPSWGGELHYFWDADTVGALLAEISDESYGANGVVLSAIVVCDESVPGKGFFKSLPNLGIDVPADLPGRMSLWAELVRNIYQVASTTQRLGA